jgi:hypothetical protein
MRATSWATKSGSNSPTGVAERQNILVTQVLASNAGRWDIGQENAPTNPNLEGRTVAVATNLHLLIAFNLPETSLHPQEISPPTGMIMALVVTLHHHGNLVIPMTILLGLPQVANSEGLSLLQEITGSTETILRALPLLVHGTMMTTGRGAHHRLPLHLGSRGGLGTSQWTWILYEIHPLGTRLVIRPKPRPVNPTTGMTEDRPLVIVILLIRRDQGLGPLQDPLLGLAMTSREVLLATILLNSVEGL